MRDILEELGINHNSHKLEDTWLDFYATTYAQHRKNFSESLCIVQKLFHPKNEDILAKSYSVSNPDFEDPEYMQRFWEDVNIFIKQNTSDDWSFSFINIEDDSKYLDQYDDFPEDYKIIDLYACVKSFENFTSQEQQDAINTLRYNELKLKESKEALDHYKRGS